MTQRDISWKHHFIELLVVIIGISIAFTFDEYGDRKKERREMRYALESMADDLVRDIDIFNDGQIPGNQRRIDELNYVIEKFRAEDFYSDSLGLYLARTLGSANSRITTATYETLKASGKLDNIAEPILKKKIIAHYEGNYKQSDYLSNSNIEYSQKLRDYIVENSTVIIDADFANIKLMEDPVFQGMLIVRRSMIQFKVAEYKRMSESSEELLELINQEIK